MREDEALARHEDHAVAEPAQATPGNERDYAGGLRRAGQSGHAQHRAPQQHAPRSHALAPRGQHGLAECHDQHEDDDGQAGEHVGRQGRSGRRQRARVSRQEGTRQFLGQHEQEQRQAQPGEHGGAVRCGRAQARAGADDRVQQLARQEDGDDEHHAQVQRGLEQDVADVGAADLRLHGADAPALSQDGHFDATRVLGPAAVEQDDAGVVAQRQPGQLAVLAADLVHVRAHAHQLGQREAVIERLADQLADRAAHCLRLALQLRAQEFLEGALRGPGHAQHANHHGHQDRGHQPRLQALPRERGRPHSCGAARRATSASPAAASSVVEAQPASTISTRRSRMCASAARDEAAA